MTNSLITRLDRIEEQTPRLPVKYAWINRNETEEGAIARTAAAHGVSAEEFLATNELTVIGWQRA